MQSLFCNEEVGRLIVRAPSACQIDLGNASLTLRSFSRLCMRTTSENQFETLCHLSNRRNLVFAPMPREAIVGDVGSGRRRRISLSE